MTREKLESLLKVAVESGVATALEVYDYQVSAETIISDREERDKNDPARMKREFGESIAEALNAQTKEIVEQTKR